MTKPLILQFKYIFYHVIQYYKFNFDKNYVKLIIVRIMSLRVFFFK